MLRGAFSQCHLSRHQLHITPFDGQEDGPNPIYETTGYVHKITGAICLLVHGDTTFKRPPELSWMSDKPQKQAKAKSAQATFSTNIFLTVS